MSKSSLKIRVISWDIGSIKKDRKAWSQELQKSWDIVMKRDFDILALCVQEDWNGKYGNLGESIGKKLEDGYVMAYHVLNGPPDILKNPFSVKVFLYMKKTKGVAPNYSIAKDDVCLSRTVFCTKAAVGVSLSIFGFQIIVISANLPTDPEKEDYGYKSKLKAMDKLFTKVYEKLVDHSVQQRVSIIAGNLNFRDNTPITDGGSEVEDQLKYAMEGEKKTFRNFVEGDIKAFPPTCKLRTAKMRAELPCRKGTITKFDPSCYQNEERPSHCDRILYRLDNLTGRLLSYKSWGTADSIDFSEHNLVYADFEITG